jgi:hypothetical protein
MRIWAGAGGVDKCFAGRAHCVWGGHFVTRVSFLGQKQLLWFSMLGTEARLRWSGARISVYFAQSA